MHIHSLKRAAIAACVVGLATAPAAMAASVPAQLRVEGAGGADLTHGWTYYSDSATMKTHTSDACHGSGKTYSFEGPTALGILEQARQHTDALNPVRISDQFDFGMLVCRIGEFSASGADSYWTYKVNHVAPEVAAEQYALKPGDDVLWAFTDNTIGSNTGNELELVAPRTVVPDTPFEVTVNQYDFGGQKSPAAGAEVGGAVTDENGKATLAFGQAEPAHIIRAYRGGDIPSPPKRVCVTRCKRLAQKRIFGTYGPDVIRAHGDFAEFIYAAGGDDRIDVRGDAYSYSDKVRCGAGHDRVRADEEDRVARDCEEVSRG